MKKLTNLKSLSVLLAFVIVIVFAFSFSWAASTRNFTKVQKLSVNPESNIGDFGLSLDMEGSTALIGSSGSVSTGGGAYIFEYANSQWVEKQALTFSGNQAITNNFGWSVALDGNRALIGAYNDGHGEGAAYIFENINGTWTEQQKLIASDIGGTFDLFGHSVALQGNTAVIGAYTHGFGTPYQQGAVYVFEYENGHWVEKQKLSAPDGFNFGYDVDIQDKTIVIGAPQGQSGDEEYQGAVYFFEKANGSWTQQQKLVASDHAQRLGFGMSVLLEGDTTVISAVNIHPEQEYPSAVYIFGKVNGAWVEQQTLIPLDTQEHNGFGFDLALQGNSLMVTSPGENSVPGSAYSFILENGSWIEQQKFIADSSVADNLFGTGVDLDGDMLLIGSSECTVQTWPERDCPGAVYVYTNPELVPTATYTPGGPTITPEPTATNTPLPDGTVELLVNGGFEVNADSNQSPDGWKLKQATGDKPKCNDGAELIAFEGLCAFQFKGGDGENSKLQQNVDLTAHVVNAGDTLTLGGQVWAKGDVDSKVTLKVKYTTLSTDKVVVNVSMTGNATAKQWTAFGSVQSSLSLTVAEMPTDITLQIKHNSASGKVRYDALTLTQQTSGLLALP